MFAVVEVREKHHSIAAWTARSNDMAWHRNSTTGPGLPELQVSKPAGIWSRPSSTLPNAETAEVPWCVGTDHILVARVCYGRAQSQRSDEVNEADGTSPCLATG